MPTVPAWMGNAIERMISSQLLHLEVSEVTYLSPSVKKVRFVGDLSQANFAVGYAIAIRVNERDYRNYTPLLFDREAGICEIIFHIHGHGPGSEFADKLQPGDQLRTSPARGKKFYDNDKDAHFFFGDETSLGLYVSLAQLATAQGRFCHGILELDATNLFVPAALGLQVQTVLRSSTIPGQAATTLLESMGEDLATFRNGAFYLTGNGHALQRFRKALRTLPGNKSLYTQAYWIEGKKGL